MADRVLVLDSGSGLLKQFREAVAKTGMDLDILVECESTSSLAFIVFDIRQDRDVDRFIDISEIFPSAHPIIVGTPESGELVMALLAEMGATFLPTLDDPQAIELALREASVTEETLYEWN